MPKDTYKSAAVPFVNTKGERSMKKVKVERYVAGKKPAYAKEDEDDEYYTTDDESNQEQDEYGADRQTSDDDSDTPNDQASASKVDSDIVPKNKETYQETKSDTLEPQDEDSDDDDPRFRKLKQLESKPSTSRAAEIQATSRFEEKRIIYDEDEDEEEVRERHAVARARELDEPIGPQAVLGDQIDTQVDLDDQEPGQRQSKQTTDDILKDFKLTGVTLKGNKPKEDSKIDDKLKEMLDKAKEEAIFSAQVHKRLEEDKKLDAEKLLLRKGDFGTNDMNMVNTDDEDDEIAYEEWKLREIKRVLRDRSERAIEKIKAR